MGGLSITQTAEEKEILDKMREFAKLNNIIVYIVGWFIKCDTIDANSSKSKHLQTGKSKINNLDFDCVELSNEI